MSNYAKSHEWVFNEYHKPDATPELKAYRLKTLKDRANNGSKTAQEYVNKIERASCVA